MKTQPALKIESTIGTATDPNEFIYARVRVADYDVECVDRDSWELLKIVLTTKEEEDTPIFWDEL